MYCPHCRAELADAARFCSSCGKLIERNVAGLPVPGDFCPLCGKAASESAPEQPAPVPQPNPNPVPSPLPDFKRKVSKTMVLNGVLIAMMFLVPWFEINYYYGSTSFSLFTLQDTLGRFSSLMGSMSSGGGASSGLAAAGFLALMLGLIPIVLLAHDIYKEVKTQERRLGGAIGVIASALLSGLAVFSINASIGSATSSAFGASIGDGILSLGLGWWLTIGVAVADYVIIRRTDKDHDVSDGSNEAIG